MKTKRANMLVCLIIMATLYASSAPAITNTWTGGAGNSNWFTAGNWDVDVPSNGVDVVISSGSVLLTNETAELASLTMNGDTDVFQLDDAFAGYERVDKQRRDHDSAVGLYQ